MDLLGLPPTLNMQNEDASYMSVDRLAEAGVRLVLTPRPRLDLKAGSGGWVAVLRVPPHRAEEDWALELLRRDVVVHPGHFYDLEGEAHLVVSLIVEPAHFDAGLERIESLADEA